MKPFRFSLQPLRVLREQREQAAQKRYAEALRNSEAAAARMRAACEELDAAWATMRSDLASGVFGLQLLRSRAWCNVLELRVRERARELDHAKFQVRTVREELLIATREREALDHYHDKSRRAYDREFARAEQNALDEMAVQRAETTTASSLCSRAAVRAS